MKIQKANYVVLPGETIKVGPFQEGRPYRTYEEGEVAALTEGQAAIFLERGLVEPTKKPASKPREQIWRTLPSVKTTKAKTTKGG